MSVELNHQISKSLLRKKFSDIKSPPKPEWIKVSSFSENVKITSSIVKKNRLTTVCEEALCPNISDCWSQKHATFMILGDTCTRSCSFCNIQTGKPLPVDIFEPIRVAKAIKDLKLNHVVITSVDRDDLEDGGASHFKLTIEKIKKFNPKTTIEILTPDFFNKDNAESVLYNSEINVFNHNLETIERLYPDVRPGANYKNSINLLNRFKVNSPSTYTKSGIMIGLGEKTDEIIRLMDDLLSIKVDFLTIGQYLRPTKNHFPVIKYHEPSYFHDLKKEALIRGFKIVSSSPFTRSSFHADKDFNLLRKTN